MPVSLTISPMRDNMLAQNALVGRFQNALAEIKTLRGLLPVCMHCKRIRADQGFWQQMHRHTNVEFSPGLCPDCFREQHDKLV